MPDHLGFISRILVEEERNPTNHLLTSINDLHYICLLLLQMNMFWWIINNEIRINERKNYLMTVWIFTFAMLHYFEWLGTSDQDGEYIVKSNCLADMCSLISFTPTTDILFTLESKSLVSDVNVFLPIKRMIMLTSQITRGTGTCSQEGILGWTHSRLNSIGHFLELFNLRDKIKRHWYMNTPIEL